MLLMALTKFGFIVTGSGLDPAVHRMQMTSPSFEMRVIGVAGPEQGPAVALDLEREGVQLIELCGGFGPRWTAAVIEALEGRIPVGSVGYGPESVAGVNAVCS